MFKNTLPLNWVWFSDINSVKEKKYSVLAIFEIAICTFFAIIYSQTVPQLLVNLFKFVFEKNTFIDNQFLSYVSNISYLFFLIPLVPIILMRSPESVLWGQKKLENYWISITFFEISKTSEIIIAVVAAFLGCTMITLFSDPIINLINLEGNLLFAFSALVSSVLSFISTVIIFTGYSFTLSFKAKNFQQIFFKILPTIAFVIFCTSIQIYYHTNILQVSVYHIVFLFLIFLLLIHSRKDEFINTNNEFGEIKSKFGLLGGFPDANPFSTFFTLPFIFGLAVRLLFIRVISSLKYWRKGFINVQKNWKDLNFSTDFLTTTSLMPNAEAVSPKLSTKGLISFWSICYEKNNYPNRKYKFTKLGTFACEKLILIQGIAAYFIVANCYRWALKSTFWAWWLIAISFKKKLNYSRIRDNRTKTTIGWATNPILFTIFIYGIIFFTYYFGDKEFSTMIDSVMKSTINIRSAIKENIVSSFHILAKIWVLFLVPIVCLLLYVKATEVNSLFKKDLEDRKIKNLKHNDQKLYQKSADSLEFLRACFWFVLCQSVWWITLAVVLLPNIRGPFGLIKTSYIF